MNFYERRFNIILLAATTLALACGCATTKKEDKDQAALRVHIESSANVGGSGETVRVLRSEPVEVTITTDPILTEANIIAAKLLETPGGFAVEVNFDETGSQTLEQYSAGNPGKHFAIYGQWGEKLKRGGFKNGRWLAAPIIGHRIGNGILAFTPDASRDEAKQLVLGLNNAAKQAEKNR